MAKWTKYIPEGSQEVKKEGSCNAIACCEMLSGVDLFAPGFWDMNKNGYCGRHGVINGFR